MKKGWVAKTILAGVILLLIAAGACYYVTLPAINIHAPGFWTFVIFVFAVATVIYALFRVRLQAGRFNSIGQSQIELTYKTPKDKLVFKTLFFVTVASIVIYFIGSILSSDIINASKYQKLMSVETRQFTEDIHEINYNQIPILDRESAVTIGNRVMGTMVDMVSQFEISNRYAQINYDGKPVRVSPLRYGSLVKWFTNNSDGLPGYVKIDMTTQNAEIVRLEDGIKYSTSDHFGRNIYRHLRFAYPTYIFDDINFEINDDGVPYWVCPVKKYNIGLFGGVTIGRVVLCNAITGEMEDYSVEEAPSWIDKVFSAEMLISLYDYHGTLKHGFINSILSQRDCLVTTNGYNYVAMDDDVWVYTGVTSVGQDESNVGFVLMNQRTMECRYYEIAGAEEYSAMSSAEGKVQHLNYRATFPLLLNVGGEPTYFMALKDGAGLVKCYAMLNMEKYQTVAIGDTVSECEDNYKAMMLQNGITVEPEAEFKSVKGTITDIVHVVIDGNTHAFIKLDSSSSNEGVYSVSIKDNPEIVMKKVGDKLALKYEFDENNRPWKAVIDYPALYDWR